MVKPAIKLQAYKTLALHPDNLAPKFPKRDAEDEGRMLEKRFWSALGTQAMRAPLYAADVSGCSLFDDAHDARPWDMRDLDTLLQRSIAPVEVARAPPRPQPAGRPAGCWLLPWVLRAAVRLCVGLGLLRPGLLRSSCLPHAPAPRALKPRCPPLA